MTSQYKRKIKVVTIHDDFFRLFEDDSDCELLKVKEEMHRRPCLILIKIRYKNKKYTFCPASSIKYFLTHTKKYIFCIAKSADHS